MHDKYKITSNCNINNSDLDKSLETISNKKESILDKNYGRCNIYKKDNNHIFTHKYNPKLSTLKQNTFETNPNHFSTFLELVSLFNQFIDLNSLELSRIDHAVDIPYPLDYIQARIRVKNKIKRSDYDSDKLTGFEIGRGNEIIVVYDKAYEIISKKKYRLIDKTSLGNLTRIEVRHKGPKIQHNKFLDLPKYLESNPFNKISLYEFSNSPEMSELEKRKAEYVKGNCETWGLQHTFKSLNASNNFSKTYSKYISPSEINKIILEDYRSKLSNFFSKE